MHGFFSWVTLLISWANQEDLQKCNVKLCLLFLFRLLPVCPVLSFLGYLCLLTRCISIYFFLHFCHCNLYQQSRCLNNAKPILSFNHMYSFFYPSPQLSIATKEFMGNFEGGWQAQKKLTRNSFWRFKRKRERKKSQTENINSHNSTITQPRSSRETFVTLKDGRPSVLQFFCSRYVAFFYCHHDQRRKTLSYGSTSETKLNGSI